MGAVEGACSIAGGTRYTRVGTSNHDSRICIVTETQPKLYIFSRAFLVVQTLVPNTLALKLSLKNMQPRMSRHLKIIRVASQKSPLNLSLFIFSASYIVPCSCPSKYLLFDCRSYGIIFHPLFQTIGKLNFFRKRPIEYSGFLIPLTLYDWQWTWCISKVDNDCHSSLITNDGLFLFHIRSMPVVKKECPTV